MSSIDTLAEAAIAEITDGMTVALGTGRAAARRGIRALARRVAQEGLRVRCTPTSESSMSLARSLGLDAAPLSEFDHIDVLFDGADEFDDRLRMLKGGGGAMTREMIAARIADRCVYLAQEAKRSNPLGRRAPLPIEVIEPARGAVERLLDVNLGLRGAWRADGGGLYRTDQRALVFDAVLTPDLASDLEAVARGVERTPGVIGHGLFLDEASAIFIEDDAGAVTALRRADG